MRCLLTFLVYILLLSGALYDTLAMNEIRMDNLKYKGCFDPSYSLGMKYHKHMIDITLEGCIDICSIKSTRYIGIELSENFCYCGDDIVENSNSRDDSMCNVLCSDVSTRTCGGDWLMSVYDTIDHKNRSVSFLIGLSAGVRVYNVSSLPNYETVMVTGDHGWAFSVDYHFAKRLVYANTDGALIMVNVTQSFGTLSSTPSVIRTLSSCHGFAVNWVLDKIYWVDCTNIRPPIIYSMDLDGSNNEIVSKLSGNPRIIRRMEVDPYNRMLFWLADGVIESFNFTNKVFQANLSGEGILVPAMALDRSVQRVYYVGSENQVTALFSMDYRGKGQIEIFQGPQFQIVFHLGVQGGFVYWINNMPSDILYKAPLQIGGGRNSTMLQTVGKKVWHMRVVHSDVQTAPVKNVCSKKGCSHFCQEQSSNSAICLCPDNFQLVGDGLSCETSLSVNITLSPLHFTSPTIAPRISELTMATTNNPETSQFGDATHVGCFGTNNIPIRNHHKMNNITLQACIQMCVDLKMTFAGISASDKTCFCGADLPLINPRSTDFLCSDHCPDKPRLPCGGDWLMSVYDISKMLPLGEESDVDILAKDVNILISETDSVKLYNLTNLNTSQLLFETENELAYMVDYHFNRNLLFVSTKKAMYKTTLFPKSIPTTPSTQIIKMTNCEGFAVDWMHDRIFWVDCSNFYASVKFSDLEGRNSTTVLMRSDYPFIKKMVIDPYVGKLFWINIDVIESCETNGANLRTNISQPEITVRGVTLDISNQRIFYAGVRNILSFLYSTNYEGNDLKTVLTAPEMRMVYGLGVIRGFVYWIYWDYVSPDMLYKTPLQQNSSSQTQLLKVFDRDSSVTHMAVVDTDLQKAPRSGPCSSGSSSCLVQIVEQKKETPARVLLIGVAVVVLVLLVFGVLMYITDMKYWHIVRTKLTIQPCTEERDVVESDGRTTYNVNEDNVNLI